MDGILRVPGDPPIAVRLRLDHAGPVACYIERYVESSTPDAVEGLLYDSGQAAPSPAAVDGARDEWIGATDGLDRVPMGRLPRTAATTGNPSPGVGSFRAKMGWCQP